MWTTAIELAGTQLQLRRRTTLSASLSTWIAFTYLCALRNIPALFDSIPAASSIPKSIDSLCIFELKSSYKAWPSSSTRYTYSKGRSIFLFARLLFAITWWIIPIRPDLSIISRSNNCTISLIHDDVNRGRNQQAPTVIRHAISDFSPGNRDIVACLKCTSISCIRSPDHWLKRYEATLDRSRYIPFPESYRIGPLVIPGLVDSLPRYISIYIATGSNRQHLVIST